MKKDIWLVATCSSVLIAGAVLFAWSHPSTEDTTGSTVNQTIIPGFPRTTDSVNSLLKRENSSIAAERVKATMEARVSSWDLFQYLTKDTGLTPDKTPSWEKWPAKCDLKLSPLCDRPPFTIGAAAGTSTNGSNNFTLPTTAVQDQGDPQHALLSTVFYSPDAADWIRTNGLNSSTYLQQMIKKGDHEIAPSAPRSSIIVKEVWEAFSSDPKDASNARIGIYQTPGEFDPGDPSEGKLLPVQNWSAQVSILLDSTGNPVTVGPESRCEDRDYNAGSPASKYLVPIRCFFYKAAPMRCDQLVVFSGLPQPVGKIVQANTPCILVLVGVQIATREMERWTWSTFWWTNKFQSPGTEDRPDMLPPAFRHFAMDTLLGGNQDDRLSKMTAIYNPYLEGPSPGTKSNCLGCHSHAAYQPMNLAAKDCTQPCRDGIINPEKVLPKESLPLTICLAGTKDIVGSACQLPTSFLWSLSTNQNAYSEVPVLR